jgi:hypothetical protein
MTSLPMKSGIGYRIPFEIGGLYMLERVEERFRHLTPQGDFCSLRFVRERSEVLAVRQNMDLAHFMW